MISHPTLSSAIFLWLRSLTLAPPIELLDDGLVGCAPHSHQLQIDQDVLASALCQAVFATPFDRRNLPKYGGLLHWKNGFGTRAYRTRRHRLARRQQ